MNKLIRSELLAPAGNFEKLKTALRFGADAVYIGGKNFSLRTFADNFTDEQLAEGISLAHKLGKKVYVTVNIFAKNSDFAQIEEYLKFLEIAGADAALISDPGVIYIAKKVAPKLAIHLSTQANTLNKYAVKFWREQGLARVVLARELSLAEISEIHSFVPDIELEAFVHGAMCISYSGRCLLSDYFDGRKSNRGACVQACRWKYELRHIAPTESDEYYGAEQDDKGTYILNSKDLNMISHLKEMEECGVCSFKIEGRMKSDYYLATVINAYRRAMDCGVTPEIEHELKNIAHRAYTTAYTLGGNKETVNYNDTQNKGDSQFIAVVTDCADGYVFAEMRNRFRVGDVLEVLSPDNNFKKRFTVEEFFDSGGKMCTDGKLVQEIYKIRCPYKLSIGDYLRKPLN